MTWFTETPWPPMIVLASLAGLLVSFWTQQRQSKFLWGAGIMLVAAVGTYFLEQAIVTPREQVQAAVLGCVDAFRRGEIEETQSYLSRQAAPLRALVALGINVVQVNDDMRISDVRVELAARESRAISRFRVNATVTIKGTDFKEFQPTRWEATWQQEAGAWKMIKIKELDPITGAPLERIDYILNRLPVR